VIFPLCTYGTLYDLSLVGYIVCKEYVLKRTWGSVSSDASSFPLCDVTCRGFGCTSAGWLLETSGAPFSCLRFRLQTFKHAISYGWENCSATNRITQTPTEVGIRTYHSVCRRDGIWDACVCRRVFRSASIL
jgi:hypothetical protein